MKKKIIKEEEVKGSSVSIEMDPTTTGPALFKLKIVGYTPELVKVIAEAEEKYHPSITCELTCENLERAEQIYSKTKALIRKYS